MFRFIFAFFLAFYAGNVFSGTCSSISYSSSSANSILTSTKYNNDNSTVYDFVNDYDGGCVTDGTLEDGALNTTDFSVILNTPYTGCKVTWSDAATLSVDRCRIAVNGNWVTTTSATTVTWGCTDCSSESASTTYYLYAKTGSSGSTLNLLISTSAPNNDGYDGSGNRVLGRFWNDSGSDIYHKIEQWDGQFFANPISLVRLVDGNGHGTTATKVRRFSTIVDYVGTSFTYTDESDNDGGNVVINEPGVYSIRYTDQRDSGTSNFGISLNASSLTTDFLSLTTDAQRLDRCRVNAGGTPASCGITIRLEVNDVVRAHTDGNMDETTDPNVYFSVQKVAN